MSENNQTSGQDVDQTSTQNVNKVPSQDQIEIQIPKSSLTIEEVAAWLKTNQETVLKYITDKKLMAHKVGGKYFITEEDLFRFKRILKAFPEIEETKEDPPINHLESKIVPIATGSNKTPTGKTYPPVSIKLPAFNRILNCLKIIQSQRNVLGDELYSSVCASVQASIEFIIIGYFSNGDPKVMTYRRSMESLAKGIAILHTNGGIEKYAAIIQEFLEASDAVMSLAKKVHNENKKN